MVRSELSCCVCPRIDTAGYPSLKQDFFGNLGCERRKRTRPFRIPTFQSCLRVKFMDPSPLHSKGAQALYGTHQSTHVRTGCCAGVGMAGTTHWGQLGQQWQDQCWGYFGHFGTWIWGKLLFCDISCFAVHYYCCSTDHFVSCLQASIKSFPAISLSYVLPCCF